MNRRAFLSGLAAAAVQQASATDRPNVLFLAVDDLNDWIGCLGGHPGVKTPNMDRLAAKGTLFTRAYCASPSCNPSRASLMTGVRPSTSGVYSNTQPMRESSVLKNAVTMPQHFMSNGYRVMGGGKIYHGHFPDPESWHEYFPSQQKNRPDDPSPPELPVNGIPRTGHFDWGPVDVPDSAMGDMKTAEWAIGELSKKHDKPFFLACGIYRPHLPWYVPQKYFDMYPLDKITLPEVKDDDLDDVPAPGKQMSRGRDHSNVIEHGQYRKAVQGYLASISFADAAVGRVLDALDQSAYAKNTIVVLWSDHGWHLGEKLHWRKFALWEEATRNVLIVSAPGVTKAGTKCARTVDSMHIYPTMVELCGLPPRKELEGVSLLPLLRNPAAKWDRPAVTTYGRNNHSARSERWRYIRYHDGSEELYDHSKDELEWTNLAGKPELTRIKQEHARWLPDVNAEDSPEARNLPRGIAAIGPARSGN
jgi:arylsulfatase A-like enzyme